MAEIPLYRKIEAEKENVERTLADLEGVIGVKDKSVVELAATATFLHNIYKGIENILKQVLKAENIGIPRSEIWHKELLDLSVSNNILSEDLSVRLHEYLAFRHFFVHGYGFMLEEAPLNELAKDIAGIWSEFLSEIDAFVDML